MTNLTDELKDVPEAAERLRCGRTHVFHLIKTGELRSVRIGRKRLIPASEIDAYVDRLLAQQQSA